MQLVIWAVYFITDVYGHVALKLAGSSSSLTGMLFSFWGITAALAWIISGGAWMLVLSKHPLLTASTVSSATYIFIALAAALIFKEPLTPQNLLGIAFVCIGIYLVTR